MFKIEDNSIGQYQTLDFDKILVKRNWDEINKNIQKEIEKAENWLKNALEKPTRDKSEYDDINFLYMKAQLDKQNFDKNIKLLANKDKLKKHHLKYKILSKILIGKTGEFYKMLYKENKRQLKEIKKFAK